MQRILALALTVPIALSGCASYTPSSAPVPKMDAMPSWQAAGAVTAGADPYVQPERQRATFDEALGDAGVLPVQVFMQNRGERRIVVRRSDMVLILPDGRQLSPAGATAAAAKVESVGGVVGATILFGIIGFLAASSANDKARAARLADYRSKEFQDATLGKDESAHGFLYFIPPDGTPPFDAATLTVRPVDAEDASSSVVRLPLGALNFTGVAGQPQQGSGSPGEPGR